MANAHPRVRKSGDVSGGDEIWVLAAERRELIEDHGDDDIQKYEARDYL